MAGGAFFDITVTKAHTVRVPKREPNLAARLQTLAETGERHEMDAAYTRREVDGYRISCARNTRTEMHPADTGLGTLALRSRNTSTRGATCRSIKWRTPH